MKRNITVWNNVQGLKIPPSGFRKKEADLLTFIFVDLQEVPAAFGGLLKLNTPSKYRDSVCVL